LGQDSQDLPESQSCLVILLTTPGDEYVDESNFTFFPKVLPNVYGLDVLRKVGKEEVNKIPRGPLGLCMLKIC